MTVRELARTAATEIRAHKARSVMTAMSLAIGIAAMLFTFSQTAGMMRRYDDAIRVAGPGRVKITMREDYVSKGRSPGLTYADAKAIRAQYPELYMVYPFGRGWGTKMRLDRFTSDRITTLGITEEWGRRDWVYTARGRFLSARDVAEGARVCVLVQAGGWIKKPYWAKYFPAQAMTEYLKRHDALGKQVKLGDHLFTVVGILQEPPRDRDPRWFRWNDGADGTVLVPISSFQAYLTPKYQKNPDQVAGIELETGDGNTAGPYIKKVQALLLARHRGEDDVELKDFRQIMDGALKQIRQFIASILVIGIVAIVASGIGIMNVTLATIFSRVREIGIRRALGATRADIVWQFVVEAMALGVVGGAMGTVIGVAGIAALAPRAERMAPITATHVLGSLAIALATGFFFSLYPAYKASRFDPIEALRYE